VSREVPGKTISRKVFIVTRMLRVDKLKKRKEKTLEIDEITASIKCSIAKLSCYRVITFSSYSTFCATATKIYCLSHIFFQ